MQIDWIHHSDDGSGTLNLCFNALDRHVVRGHGDRTALVYDSAVAQVKKNFTYAALLEEVAAFAGAIAC